MFNRSCFGMIRHIFEICSEEEEFDSTAYDYYDLSKEISEEEYVVRSIVAQAVMAKVHGSTKFNVAATPTRSSLFLIIGSAG